MGGVEWGWCPGGGAGRGEAPEQMVRSANNGWEPGRWGLRSFRGRGVVVMGGEAEQMGWGHVDFALNADLF